MPIDSAALEAALERLGGLIPERLGGLDELLHQTITAVDDLFGVSGAGVMVIDTGQVLRSVCATGDAGDALEAAQEQTGDGPCVQAFVYDRTTWTDDILGDERWPDVRSALEGKGVRAVMGVPVQIAGAPIGVLNVFVDRPHDWTADDRRALEGFSRVLARMLVTGVAVHRSDRLAEQLQYALDYRVVIERGIGYLMAREDVDAVTAFSRLREAARNSRRKVGDIAADMLAGAPLPSRSRHR